MFPSIEYRLSRQTEWRNHAYIFWTTCLQRSIENRQRVLTFFAVEDDRCNKITFGIVRRPTEDNNRQAT